MNQKYTYYLRYACISGALAAALALGDALLVTADRCPE